MEKLRDENKRVYRRPRIVSTDNLEVVAGSCGKSDLGSCGKTGPVSS